MRLRFQRDADSPLRDLNLMEDFRQPYLDAQAKLMRISEILKVEGVSDRDRIEAILEVLEG